MSARALGVGRPTWTIRSSLRIRAWLERQTRVPGPWARPSFLMVSVFNTVVTTVYSFFPCHLNSTADPPYPWGPHL